MRKLVVGILAVILITTISLSYFLLQPAITPRIVFARVTLTVELAEKPADQQRGLSGRDSMAPDHGMLFVFDHEDYWGFWMKDMKFRLDIIWFNSNRQAAFIEQNLPPCSPDGCPVFTPSQKAMYVLEVNAGFVLAHNVSLGDAFSFVST